MKEPTRLSHRGGGLCHVEPGNSAANAVIYYGKGGEISTDRREEVKMAALCLRILQASLVLVRGPWHTRCPRVE